MCVGGKTKKTRVRTSSRCLSSLVVPRLRHQFLPDLLDDPAVRRPSNEWVLRPLNRRM